MKKITLSLGVLVAISSLGFAGGDIAPVEPVVMAPVIMDSNDQGVYVGIGVSAVSARDTSFGIDFTSVKFGQDRLGNVNFILGYNLNKYLAVEGRYSTTFTDEDLVEMDSLSLFVKPQYPLSEDFSVYALLGYGSVEMDGVGVAKGRVDVDDSDFQWGLGTSYAIGENYTIFLDYTSLASDMDGIYYNGARQADADALTLGGTYKF